MKRRFLSALLVFFTILAWAGEEPYLLILGTAQDGGLPQVGCNGNHCVKARKDAAFKRLITSLAVVDPATGKRWLFEATPDLREQVARLEGHPATREATPGKRGPLVDGIFLTHAHMGHYTGLVHLGREAYGHPQIPVFGTQRMVDFLQNNGPWRLLVEARHIGLRPMKPLEKVVLNSRISVEALLVPHRDEFSDTFGYIIHGPKRKILFIPDIDKWSKWNRSIKDVIAKVDVALLDGTFFAEGEIPGRAMSEIPHPFIRESLELFKNLPKVEREKIIFIHFNHTNPVVDASSQAAKEVTTAGMKIAHDLQILKL